MQESKKLKEDNLFASSSDIEKRSWNRYGDAHRGENVPQPFV